MPRHLLAAVSVCVFVLGGCAVYTPGARELPSVSRAELRASSVVGFRNYEGFAVTDIWIDGAPYPLKKDKTTFVLTPGRHDVAFSYSTAPPFFSVGRRYHFEALPGGRYELASWYESAGLMHQIQTPDRANVLKREPLDLNLPATGTGAAE